MASFSYPVGDDSNLRVFCLFAAYRLRVHVIMEGSEGYQDADLSGRVSGRGGIKTLAVG